jgi:uncharacterized membrane protein
MLPDPLHPAVVHLPIALALVVPLFAAAGVLAIRSGFLPARAWLAVVLLQALLAGSAWVAVETGEDQAERVERVVAEKHVDEHAEAAEWFASAASVAALICAAGLLPDRIGRAARITAALASLGVLAAAVRVGHLGGELVYKYGAARVYSESSEPAPEPTP